jgi:hypothetical protein
MIAPLTGTVTAVVRFFTCTTPTTVSRSIPNHAGNRPPIASQTVAAVKINTKKNSHRKRIGLPKDSSRKKARATAMKNGSPSPL